MTMQNTTRRGLRVAAERRTNVKRAVATGLGALLAASSIFGGTLAASADDTDSGTETLSFTETVSATSEGVSPWLDLPKFDDSLGRLVGATAHVDVSGENLLTVTNNNDFEVSGNTNFGNNVHVWDFDHEARIVDSRVEHRESYVLDAHATSAVMGTPFAESSTYTYSEDQLQSLKGRDTSFIAGMSPFHGPIPNGSRSDFLGHMTATVTMTYEYEPVKLVTPLKPELTDLKCGEQQWVIFPEIEGVIYDTEFGNGHLKVWAYPAENYVFPAGTYQWPFEIADFFECPTPLPGVDFNLSVSHNEAVAAVDTVLVYVHAMDENGEPETDPSDVHVQSTFGDVSAVELIEPGLFQATLVSDVAGEATVTFTVDDVPGEQTEQVAFVTAPLTEGTTDGDTDGVGELALTGAGAPFGVIVAIAGGLALLGAALLFRRRRAVN